MSSATSNSMIGVTAYCVSDTVDLSMEGPICLGSVARSVSGAAVLRDIRPQRLSHFFVLVLILLAAGMILVPMGRVFP